MRCPLFVGRWSLVVVRWSLIVVRCPLFVVGWSLIVDRAFVLSHGQRRTDNGQRLPRTDNGQRTPQSPHDVLHVDHGVVDDLADGDGQSSERHGVQRVAELRHDGDRGEKGEGDGRAGDGGGTEVGQKEKQDDDDEDRADEEGDADVVRGGLDELAGAKEVRPGGDMLAREERGKVVQRHVDAIRRLERVRAVLRPELEDHGRLAHDRGAADGRLGSVSHRPDVGQGEVARGLMADDGLGDLRRTDGAGIGPEDDALVAGIDKACAADARRPPRRSHDFGDVDVVRHEFPRIELHLDLPHFAAVHGDLGDARHGQNALPHAALGERPKLHRRKDVRGQPQRHQVAGGRRQRRHDRRQYAVRQRARQGRQTLGDDLPVAVHVGTLGEGHGDQREALHRLGAHRLQPFGGVDGVLHRPRDEQLDLFGRQPRRFGLDLDDLRRELGKDVVLRLRQRPDAVGEGHDGQRHHDSAEAERETDDRTEQSPMLDAVEGRLPHSSTFGFASSDSNWPAPSVTTRVPGGGAVTNQPPSMAMDGSTGRRTKVLGLVST